MREGIIRISEEIGKGTRGGKYTYVVEGNELIHISEYAIKKLPGNWKNKIIYFP